MAEPTKAMGRDAPGGIELTEVTVVVPDPGPGAVRVAVDTAAVNPADLKVLRGEFAGFMLHGRTRPLVPGYDFHGTVTAAGEGVQEIVQGDSVFGHLAYASGNRQGTLAAAVTVDQATLARVPDGISAEDAAAVPTVGLTALQALRDIGRLQAGHRCLVLGASGGVGAAAVQVAKAFGARVTGTCSAYAVEAVRTLGADEVVDRKATPVSAMTGTHDVIFDTTGLYGYRALQHLLGPAGVLVSTLPSAGLLFGMAATAFSSRRVGWVVVESRTADLEAVGRMMTDGLRVPVAGAHPWRQATDAFRQLDAGGFVGKIVVTGVGAAS